MFTDQNKNLMRYSNNHSEVLRETAIQCSMSEKRHMRLQFSKYAS